MSVAAFSFLPRVASPSWLPDRRARRSPRRSPHGPVVRRRPGPWRVRVAAALAALGLALAATAIASTSAVRLRAAARTATAMTAMTATPRPTTPMPTTSPDWSDVAHPFHLFDLDAPTLRDVPLVYSARRRTAGEGREDTLAFGTPGGSAPALRLRLFRRDPADTPPPLFAAVALLAAEAGFSIERSGLADLLTTRFGRFEIADVVLADGTAGRVSCSGFRLALDAPAFTISGLGCGAPGAPLSRDDLACLIDRLDLAGSGDDQALRDVFAAGEKGRDPGCAGARLATAASPSASPDDKPVTRHRTLRRH